MSIQYKVHITPLIASATYGTEVDVTDFVIDKSITKIRRGVDSTDYKLGVYFFDDVSVKLLNVNGKFNEDDYRSIFPHGRDLAKIRIVYTDSIGDTVTFKGLIN